MMNTKIKQEIIEQTKLYIETYGLSQAEFSKKANVRKEYLSYMLRGKFSMPISNGKSVQISDKYFSSLASIIGFRTEKVYWENKPTDQLTSTLAILTEAKRFGYTRLIVGDTGCGKSHAIELFCRKNPSDVYNVTVGSSDTLNDLIDKVIDVLGISSGKTKSKRLRDIIRYLSSLKSEGKTPQLIFDEAEYMKQAALCSIKELYDGLAKHCSIVLVGTRQLVENLTRLKRRDKNGIPQFFRRVKFGIRHLPSIDSSFKLFLGNIKDYELINDLRERCENYGELHDVLVPSMREADRLNMPLSLNLIKQVLSIQ